MIFSLTYYLLKSSLTNCRVSQNRYTQQFFITRYYEGTLKPHMSLVALFFYFEKGLQMVEKAKRQMETHRHEMIR